MKVFITGVSGFVGSGLVDHLNTLGDISIVGHGRDISLLETRFEGKRIEFISSYSAEVFDEMKIDCIVHLAGIAHDLSRKYQTEDYYRVNLNASIFIYNEFIRSKATKFIFMSSIKACVDASFEPVDEQAAPNPSSDYGLSKLRAEEYILNYSPAPDKNVYIFRPCMTHGRGNKGNLNLLYKYVKSGLPYIFGMYVNRRSFLTAGNLNFIIEKFLRNNFTSGIYHLADDGYIATTDLIRIISLSLSQTPRVWNISPKLLDSFSKSVSFFGLPAERMKGKLTESLVVSTDKLKGVLHEPLPLEIRTGLLDTLKSFDE